MIQFNLLPDIKVKYIKARRQKRRTIAIASIIGLSSVSLLALMMIYVYGIQSAQLASLNSKISKTNDSLQNQNNRVDDIDKVLTVQNQLITLDGLHADKPVSSRVYDYLAKMVPADVAINNISFEIDTVQTLVLQGSAQASEKSLALVNEFVDTLKFSTYSVEEEQLPVFSNVVLSSFSRDESGSSYVISMSYDPIIFSGTFDPLLVSVPEGKTTTRSELGRPLFQTVEEIQASNAEEDQ